MNLSSGAPTNRGIMGDDDQGDAALVELFEKARTMEGKNSHFELVLKFFGGGAITCFENRYLP